MTDTTRSLLWLIPIALTLAALLLPRVGLLARWRALRIARRRQLLEDALKLLFNAQPDGRPTDPTHLARELRLSQRETDLLLDRLTAQQLVAAQAEGFTLTAEGRRLALQVVRAHRLWERYLADEARMPLEQIHSAAHRREHQLSLAEVDRLDADLGHPARDPHGDPIPNAAGELREDKTSRMLTDLSGGAGGVIAHLEDEPPVAYAQLLAEGLYLGQPVTVVENTPARVVIDDGETRHTLALAIAANVFIRAEAAQPRAMANVIPLGSLKSQARAEIVEIDERCQGFTRRRFLDLGLTPGTPIYPELDNAFREPRAYRVRGTLIALRKDQASLIWVRPDPA